MSKSLKRFSSIIAALIAAAFFYGTSAPGIGTEDSAELAGGARMLAMVHAPGYPLYLLLGRLASALSPVPGRGLVLLSVLAGACAVGLMHHIVSRRFGQASGSIAAISMLFCQALAQAASEVEVYALSSLLITGVLGAILRLTDAPDSTSRKLLGLLLGLTLTHHTGILIHLPVIFVYAAWIDRRVQNWVIPAGYLFAALSLYLVLPILSMRNGIAAIAWDPVTSPGQLLNVMMGAGFRKLLFAVPIGQAMANIVTFPFALLLWFPILTGVFSFIGGYASYRKEPALFALLSSMIAITIFHAANYNVLDPHLFLMPAIPLVAYLAGQGFSFLSATTPLVARYSVVVVAVAFVSAFGGLLSKGGWLTNAYSSLPMDMAEVVLESHSGSDDIVWADWRYFPLLRYYQVVGNRTPNLRLDFDTTSESPASHFEEGKTYTMRASEPLGKLFPLVMKDLHWKIESGPITVDRFDSPILTVGGIAITAIETPANVDFARPIVVKLHIRRTGESAADTITGELYLLQDGRIRLTTPFSLLHWHYAPGSLAPDKTYLEPIETIIPSAHRSEQATFSLEMQLRTATESRRVPIGELIVN